jgi:hypothetical protein
MDTATNTTMRMAITIITARRTITNTAESAWIGLRKRSF